MRSLYLKWEFFEGEPEYTCYRNIYPIGELCPHHSLGKFFLSAQGTPYKFYKDLSHACNIYTTFGRFKESMLVNNIKEILKQQELCEE